MIEVSGVQEYALMFLAAAGLGMIGGLVFELLQTRATRTGTIRWPGRVPGEARTYGLGLLSSMIVGAVAAVVVLYFVPPDTTINVNGSQASMDHTVDLMIFVPIALIAGTAGQAILSAAQAQIIAVINKNNAETTRTVAVAEMERLHSEADEAIEGAMRSMMDELAPLVTAEIRDAAEGVPPSMISASGTLEIPDDRGMEALSHALRDQRSMDDRMKLVESAMTSRASDAMSRTRAELNARFDASQKMVSRVARGAEG